MTAIIFLHGLLSSSKSTKGVYLKKALEERATIITPDFYPEKKLFESMTVSLLLNSVKEWVCGASDPVILIGSSFGGLVATRYIQSGEKCYNKVKGLILIAPALKFHDVLENHLVPSNEWINWQQKGYMYVEHPAWSGKTKWSWNFIEDLQESRERMNDPLKIPVLLIHGEEDKVIPAANSRAFTKEQEKQGSVWDSYYLKEADHQMLDHLPAVVDLIKSWLVKKTFI